MSSTVANKYSVGLTVWKGVKALLVVIMGAGAAELADIKLPADWDTFRATWIAIILASLPVVWRVIENWRKNGGTNGKPLWRWPWNKTVAGLLIVALVLPTSLGCATNRQVCEERMYDGETGLPTSEFRYTQTGAVTWGSKQDEARGELDYTGPDWRLRTGNNAVGQQAGDGTEIIRALLDIAAIVAPYLQQPTRATE